MSGLTILLLLIALGTLVYLQSSYCTIKRHQIALGILIVAFVLDLILEGFRLYLIPLYISYLMTVVLFLVMIQADRLSKYRVTKKAILILSIFILIPAMLQTFMFPVGETPALRGPYPVGTRTFMMTMNANEKDQTTGTTIETLRGRLFYPAGGLSMKKAPWFENGQVIKTAIAVKKKIAPLYISNLDLIKSRSSYQQTVLADLKKLPVVIMAPEWGGFGDTLVPIAEQLASRGYVVLISETSLTSGGFYNESDERLGQKESVTATIDEIYYLFSEQLTWSKKLLNQINKGEGVEQLKGKLLLDQIYYVGEGVGSKLLLQPGQVHLDVAGQVLIEPYKTSTRESSDMAFKQPTIMLSTASGEKNAESHGIRSYLGVSGNLVALKYIPGTSVGDFSGFSLVNPLVRMGSLKIPAWSNGNYNALVEMVSNSVDDLARKSGVSRAYPKKNQPNPFVTVDH